MTRYKKNTSEKPYYKGGTKTKNDDDVHYYLNKPCSTAPTARTNARSTLPVHQHPPSHHVRIISQWHDVNVRHEPRRSYVLIHPSVFNDGGGDDVVDVTLLFS
jgi:hypothetical protein